jgi:hypothetical protein
VNRFKGRGVLFLIRYRRRDKAIVNHVFMRARMRIIIHPRLLGMRSVFLFIN